MLERDLERRLSQEVKKAGGFCIKLPANWYRGIPDRLILLPGARVVFVELKTDRGVVSAPQSRWVKALRGLGFDARVIKGEPELNEFLGTFM
jgi:hypothetical protein